ncbi:DUF2975 domain-containing protein [Thalassotalea euphylliae]|uniref:DUF2975 domain-containing protein n=1 Tax=Thalassotalea euphylliae TaxID=1655234 RepID=A0A3E0U4L5_9GAMM|nr:DUF2975 domain-containing protein [Thalassotalea euphylliae]REL31644.1 DUF2975 domain-containing protein [Thalassotalea euphylliae]
MIAFQKLCQLNQGKIMGFTIFMGIMTLMSLVGGIAIISKKGVAEFASDPVFFNLMITVPTSFIFLLLVHKIFNLYIQGEFFTANVLNVFKTIAKLAISYGLIIKPGIMIATEYLVLANQGEDFSFTTLYLGSADFVVAVIGYCLHLAAAVTKISRELEEEQELTI